MEGERITLGNSELRVAIIEMRVLASALKDIANQSRRCYGAVGDSELANKFSDLANSFDAKADEVLNVANVYRKELSRRVEGC
jgi:hypothetical protein